MSGTNLGTSGGKLAGKLNETWDFDDPSRLLKSAGSVGDTDAERYANIVETRTRRAREVIDRLGLSRNDCVVELGSGLGITAKAVAPSVKRLICADISTSFLEQCRNLNRDIANVEPVLIKYADLSAIQPPVDKIYSLLLFIHFNTYDFIYYLSECNRILRPGGRFYFDFHDGARVRIDSTNGPDGGIARHLALYKQNRSTWVFQCMHLCSRDTLMNLLPQVGFELRRIYQSRGSFTEVLVEKVRDCPNYVPSVAT
jgi:cyclopropane fatty-acyl-phospholipid synthase-like methyltransferase